MRTPFPWFAIAVFSMLAALTSTSGCRARPLPAAASATAVLIDMEGMRHDVPRAEAEYLAGIAATAPSTDTADHLSLDPPYRVIVGGLDLALEPDELILMHENGTKRWRAPGVQQRILAAVGR